jgi:hypothetical protein
MAHEVGAGELAEEAGVSIRTIQFWTDAGVLRVIRSTHRKGRGNHRLYNAEPPLFGERACALIAAELHRLRIPIGVMLNITYNLVRNPSPHVSATIENALAGQPMTLSISFKNPDSILENVIFSIMTSENSPESENLYITKADERIDPGIRSGYLLNLTHILKPLRT